MEAMTLYELNRMVRGALENVLHDEYWLQAELSEVREGANGHCYLEFVEKPLPPTPFSFPLPPWVARSSGARCASSAPSSSTLTPKTR